MLQSSWCRRTRAASCTDAPVSAGIADTSLRTKPQSSGMDTAQPQPSPMPHVPTTSWSSFPNAAALSPTGAKRGTSCSLLPAASGTKQGSPWQSWGEHQTLASVPRGRRELAQIPPPLPRELFPSRNRAAFFQGEPSSRARGWRRSRRGCLGSVPLGARLGVLRGSEQGAASPSWPPNAPNYQSCELSEP